MSVIISDMVKGVMGLDMLRLNLFASLARTLNFSRTAEQYFITQPAVSHHIKKLEAELGVKLINRSSHEVSLTAEGEEFLSYISQILEISSTAENRIQNMAKGQLGHIRIAALSYASYQLCNCLSKLYEMHPHIQADIDLLEGAELIRSLQQGDHDFYFAARPMIPDNDEYSHEIIHRGRLEVFVNKNIADTIDLNDWSTVEMYPFVSVPQSGILASQIRLICKNRDIKPRIINYYNRAESVVLSVNAGIGVAILPGELGYLYQRPDVITFPISGKDAEITTVFAWKKDIKATAFKIFKEVVLSLYKESL
ncbi:MAG: LysR family transcriptional regulator [Oscillospiraceae bacterium]|nr:LysR family transcriptional regulator [Oscillospiraceae bacterium]